MGKPETWEKVVEYIIGKVDLKNEGNPGKCKILQRQPHLALMNERGETAVFEFDKLLKATFTLVGEGTPRRGEFGITQNQMIEKREFVGAPNRPQSLCRQRNLSR